MSPSVVMGFLLSWSLYCAIQMRPERSLKRSQAATPSDETYPVFQHAFDSFNHELFEGKLPHVLLTLQRKANTCGYLSANRFANAGGAMVHELAMNPEWFAV